MISCSATLMPMTSPFEFTSHKRNSLTSMPLSGNYPFESVSKPITNSQARQSRPRKPAGAWNVDTFVYAPTSPSNYTSLLKKLSRLPSLTPGPPPLRRNSTRIPTRRSLHKLLHSRPTQNYTEDECSTLVNSFNSFFITKITKIHESIANTLASSPISPFHTRQFSGTLSQSFNLCLQKRSSSSFIHCPISHLLLTLSPLL